MREKLTAAYCEKTKIPGVFADGGGLYLEVKKDGRKYWCFRWRDRNSKYTTGKSAGISRLRQKGLGPYGKYDVTLKEARVLAGDCRRMLRKNTNPATEARQKEQEAIIKAENTLTFKECTDRYYDSHKAGWSDRHAVEWLSSLKKHAAKLMPMDVDAITTQTVFKCLEEIWQTRTVTASRVRQRIESILDWATVYKLRTGDNPARWKGHMDNLLPAPKKLSKVVHQPALDYQQAGVFMKKLRAVDTVAAKVLEFQILTATRPGVAVGPLWAEIEGNTWTVPAERMKSGVEHEIPLSPQAVELLKNLPRVNKFVFPGLSLKKPMTTRAGMLMLEGLHPGITQHGFRSTFRVWASELTSYPSEVIEHALAHRLKDATQRAYDRKTMFPKRVKLMEAWATYCDLIPADDADNVTPIRKGNAQ